MLSLIVTRSLITFFRTRGLGQPILGKEDRGPEHHMAKQGTPTMGGIAIVVAALIGWIVAHIRRGLPFSDQALIVWVGIIVMAFMGFLDDFIKVRRRHNRGIFWKQKNYVTMLLSFGIAWWLVATDRHLDDDLAHPRRLARLGACRRSVWVIFAGLIIWATTNAVNVTDGLDGLAGGVGADGLRRVHDHRLLGVPQPRRSTAPSSTRSTSPSSPPPSPGRAWGSCGSTPRRRASSWATSARSASGRRWRCWR